MNTVLPKRLSASKYWVADGTFGTVPSLFKQLFTVHGSVGPDHNHTVPLVYALLTGKSENLYGQVLAKISELGSEINIELEPAYILTDFEKGMVNAFHPEYPDSKQIGCFFHFCQNLWKKVQSNGLVPLFESQGSQMYHAYRLLQALAFIPLKDIPKGILAVVKNMPEALHPVVAYLEKNYVLGRKKAGKSAQRTRPLFPPSFWSVYENVLQELPRTTNQAEAWHSRWTRVVGAHHVGTNRIVEELRLEQKATSGRVQLYFAGGGDTKRIEYLQKDEKLLNVVKNYKKYNITDYLNAISLNLIN